MTHTRRRNLVIAQRFYGRVYGRPRENGLAVATKPRPAVEPTGPARGSGAGFASRVPLQKTSTNTGVSS